MRSLLQVPLFGFCGAPWTLVAYMIEVYAAAVFTRVHPTRCFQGGGSKTWSKALRWFYLYPDRAPAARALSYAAMIVLTEMEALLTSVANACIDHLVNQALAGAQALQVRRSRCHPLEPSLMHMGVCAYVCVSGI